MMWVLIALLVIILIIAFNTIKIVKQSEVLLKDLVNFIK